jgi:hypothetical protein
MGPKRLLADIGLFFDVVPPPSKRKGKERRGRKERKGEGRGAKGGAKRRSNTLTGSRIPQIDHIPPL